MSTVATIVALVVILLVLSVTAAILCSAAALIVMVLPPHPRLKRSCVAMFSLGTYMAAAPLLLVLQR